METGMQVSASKEAEIQDLKRQQRESLAKGMGCLESKPDAAQVRSCVPRSSATWCTQPPLVAAALVLIALPEARPGFSVPDDHHIVHVEATLGLALTDHAQTAVNQRPRVNPPRDRPPIVYFYSRGGRQITNRGAEVFHQLQGIPLRQKTCKRGAAVMLCALWMALESGMHAPAASPPRWRPSALRLGRIAMRLRGGLAAADPVEKPAEAEAAVARMIDAAKNASKSAGGVCWGQFVLLFSPRDSPAARCSCARPRPCCHRRVHRRGNNNNIMYYLSLPLS
jgi:hypothetical protein